MHKQVRGPGQGVSRRVFLRKAAVGASVAMAAGASAVDGGQARQTRTAGAPARADAGTAPSAPPGIRIPHEITAGSNAAPSEIQFPMTGAQVFARACKEEGVAALFCCPGNYGVIHAIAATGIPTFSGRHEGSMTHAADAFSRVSGELAVASGTEGPGFTDMICGRRLRQCRAHAAPGGGQQHGAVPGRHRVRHSACLATAHDRRDEEVRLPVIVIVYNNNAWGTWTTAREAKALPLHLFQENVRYDKVGEALGASGQERVLDARHASLGDARQDRAGVHVVLPLMHRSKRRKGMVPVGVVVSASCAAALWLGALLIHAQGAHPPQPHRHPSAQQISNPVPQTPESIAAGRRIYASLCVRCHGPTGKGDGGGAGGGGQPADLTDAVWEHGASDGEIFVVLRDGTSVDMEGYGERVKEADLWNVVNYLKTLQAARAK